MWKTENIYYAMYLKIHDIMWVIFVPFLVMYVLMDDR